MLNKKLFFSLVLVLICISAIGFYGISGNNNELSSNISNAPQHYLNGSVDIHSGNNTPDMIGAWTVGPVFPVPLADLGHGQGYSRNDTGWFFVIGGEVGQTNVRIYNNRTNAWTTGAPLPVGKDRGGSARLGDSLYMIGGANASNVYTPDLYRYDIRSNTWVSRAPILSGNLGWSDGVGYQDSLIYVAGGFTGTATVATVQLYNARTNTWRQATPLPAIRFGGAFAISGDTLVYCGGVDGAAVMNATYRGVISQVDRSVITWTTGAPMPTGMFRIDGASWGCKGVIVTGGSSAVPFTSVSNACLVYSPGANTWTPQANKITPWTAGQMGTYPLSADRWQLVCASGYGGTAQINNVEIFTDTLCPLVGISQIGSEIPSKYSLQQNYPNPFNPTTNISFGLPTAGLVKLVVYDITGREIETLVNEFKGAGSYNVDFNASSLSSGIYFYSLESEGFKDTKRMVLVK